MIFVTVGSQKFQFNRLLEEIDKLIENGVINEEVFAQTGYSDYVPKNYEYKDFLDKSEFKDIISRSNLVITHGGTGAIISSVKAGKKTIAVARNPKFGEHVDAHQRQIVDIFVKKNIIAGAYDVAEIDSLIAKIDTVDIKIYESNTDVIVKSLEDYIDSL